MKGRRSTTELGESRAKKSLKVGEKQYAASSNVVSGSDAFNVTSLPLVNETGMDTSDEELAPAVVPPLFSDADNQQNNQGAPSRLVIDIERMMKTVQDNITKHFDEKLIEHRRSITKQFDILNDKLCNCFSEVSKLKGLSSVTSGGHQAKSKKNAHVKLKSEFNARNDEELNNYDICFCPSNIKLIMNIVINNYTLMKIANWSSLSNEDADLHFGFETSCVRKLEAIMFGKSSLEGKAVWKRSLGNEASNLRYMIQKSLVKNAQQNKFDNFKFVSKAARMAELEQDASNSHSYSTARSLTNNSKIPYPSWLLNIKDEHIMTVRAQREKKKLSVKHEKPNELGVGGGR